MGSQARPDQVARDNRIYFVLLTLRVWSLWEVKGRQNATIPGTTFTNVCVGVFRMIIEIINIHHRRDSAAAAPLHLRKKG